MPQVAVAHAEQSTSGSSESGGTSGMTGLMLAAFAGTLLTLAGVGGYLLLLRSRLDHSKPSTRAETTETSFATPFALLTAD